MTVILTAATLSPTDRGVYVGYLTWSTFIGSMVSLGLGPGVANQVAAFGFSRRFMSSLSVVAVALTMVALVPLFIVSRYVAKESVAFSYSSFGFSAAFVWTVLFSDWLGYALQGAARYRMYSVLRIAVPLGSLVCYVTALPLLARTSQLAVACNAIGGVVGTATIAVLFFRVVPHATEARLSHALHFGIRTHLGAVSNSLASRADAISVSILLTAPQLGVYALANSLSNPVSSVGTAIGVRNYKVLLTSDRSSLHAAHGRVVRQFLWISAPAVAVSGIAIVAASRVFGAYYHQMLWPGVVLLLASVATGGLYLGLTAVQALRRPTRGSVVVSSTALAAVALAAAGAATFGLIGAASGVFLARFMGAVWLRVSVAKIVGLADQPPEGVLAK